MKPMTLNIKIGDFGMIANETVIHQKPSKLSLMFTTCMLHVSEKIQGSVH